eukprot:s99_g1.t1
MSSSSVNGKNCFDCSGLANELEAVKEIREHLRGEKGAVLFQEGLSDNVKNACTDPVHDVLRVLCMRTAAIEGHPQPPVGPLRDELELLYKKCGAQVQDSVIVNDSWCIRKFLTFVKMKTRKEKVQTEEDADDYDSDSDANGDGAPQAPVSDVSPVNPGSSVAPSAPPSAEAPPVVEVPRPATTPQDAEPATASPEDPSSGSASSAPAVAASPGRKNPDNVDTQPLDVMNLDPATVARSPVASGSPTVSSDALRSQFQGRPAEPAALPGSEKPALEVG